MSNEEVKLFGILITAVITIIGGIVGWFGKMYLDSRIEKLKKVMHLILQTYKDKGLLPYSKLNRKNYYKRSDVQALLEAGQPYNNNDNGFTDE